MKKLIALLLALVMVLGLVACASTTTTTEPANEPAPATETPAAEEPAAEEETTAEAPAETKKTIYVLAPNPDHGWTGAIGVFAQAKVDELNAEGRYNAILQTFASADDQIKQIEDIIANNPGDGSIGVAMLPANTDLENAIQCRYPLHGC